MEAQLATRPTGTVASGVRVPTAVGPGPTVVPPQAVRLALATLEALLGRRGLHQLRPYLSHKAFLQLVEHVESGLFGHSELGGLRTQMPTALAVEASARISVNRRWLAVTVRLDFTQNWQCSDLMVLGAQQV